MQDKRSHPVFKERWISFGSRLEAENIWWLLGGLPSKTGVVVDIWDMLTNPRKVITVGRSTQATYYTYFSKDDLQANTASGPT